MIIMPAIDLKDGKCVQLVQGDPNKKLFESDDVIGIAKKFEKFADCLHIVDLNAALNMGNNRELIRKIINSISIPAQVGGGIRDVDVAKEIIDFGAERIIVGTRAILDKEFIDELKSELGKKKIVLAVEEREGKVVIKGWKEKIDKTPLEIIKEFENKVGYILYTNVNVEGLLKGIDLKKIEDIVNNSKLPIIYSGGITKLDDLINLKRLNVYGAVIGSAIYKGLIKLEDLKKVK
ncbi:1-(5-phosphoribosyl)-5-[(5-phosphoribosylamino)methylideneamino]imidazole-4-carboxamide isomerase [Methanocaldococcus villosus]|uniref:1-(5-phosphoribosyl)-5-[(5- phosphoribosylamino)methylideneamino]imidazole-4- carboxamide isomerase n=1 Tax=Methanocaldococcus villosus TaxID=667126 RepID=UPI00037E94DE|nr:1-(5-phosphoribosyl)-5-[(5-phosphoribosylamino)methylideneamino]imidazole-4-carboxamide isomerase [Methanocaldococcus villosus]